MIKTSALPNPGYEIEPASSIAPLERHHTPLRSAKSGNSAIINKTYFTTYLPFIRLKKLQYQTANQVLIEKEIGLHTLRHSIATHFLQAGMKRESISRFLGHSSLESMQIYMHLARIPIERSQPFNYIKEYESTRRSEDEHA